MLRVDDTSQVVQTIPVLPHTTIIPRKKDVQASMEACYQAIKEAGMLPCLKADLDRLQRYLQTH